MTTLWDVINSINSKSVNLREETKAYSPWIVNKAMSFNQDTVFYANEANKMSALDKELQYDWYFNAVPKKKRYGKWQKKEEESSDLLMVAAAYGINNSLAAVYLKLLNEEQLEIIRQNNNKGG